MEESKLKRLFSIITHELRGPLTAIQNSVSILRLYWDRLDAQRRTDHLEKIELQIERMDDIIKNLSLLAQTNANGIKFDPQSTDLTSMCEKIIKDLSERGKKHWIELKIDVKTKVICADHYLLEHILTNLLSNAMKYSPDKDKVWLNVTEKNNYLIFCVIDTGIGIPEDEIKNIFNIFYRGSNTDKIVGTGVGLAVVQEFIKIHKGSVAIRSKLGHGSAFYVRVPYIKECDEWMALS